MESDLARGIMPATRSVSSSWFAIADLPAGKVRVRVQWSGREFVAATGLDPRSGAWGWCVFRSGRIVWLPEDADRDSWPAQPSCWQPEDSATWPHELPQPIISSGTPRLWSARTSFGAVDDAEAADLAREMEDDREAARAQAESIARSSDDAFSGRWWWGDVGQIKYQPAGQISLEMAEGRIMRALAMCGGPGVLAAHRGTTLNLIVSAAEVSLDEIADAVEARNLRFRPMPQDHDDFDVAMAWFAALNPPEHWHHQRQRWTFNRPQQVLWARARDNPRSFSDLAHKYGVSPQRVRAIYAESISKCWRFANSLGERKRGRPRRQIMGDAA